VLADDAGGSGERGDEADLDFLLRQGGCAERDAGRDRAGQDGSDGTKQARLLRKYSSGDALADPV